MAEPHQALGEGAAQEAPTAPHATPRTGKGRKTGPERFWSRWPVRFAFAASLVLSGLAHCTAMPMPFGQSFEINEVDGEAAIPVDLFEPEPDTPPPPPPEEIKPPSEDDKGATAATATARPHPAPDAGAPRDAASDAGVTDGAASGTGLDGAIALAEAGAAPGGPRNPQAVIGAAGDIQVDKVLVMVILNGEVIRKSSVAPSLARLLRRVDQWDAFMHGTDIDPLKDIDWVMISGPSVQNTTRDVVLVRYGATDAKVGHAMDVVAESYAQHGGGDAFDAGLGSMKAVRSLADGAERVVMMPHSHVLAVVPSSAASKVARQLARASVPAHVRPGEALYMRVADPHHPMPAIPASITELRLRVVPAEDDGAEVFVEGDTASPEAAKQAASQIDTFFRNFSTSFQGLAARAMTGGLLDGVEVTSQGSVVKVHLAASHEQIVAVIGLAGDFPGVAPPPPPSGAPRPRSSH